MIAVLFARADSVYKTLPGCDVFDIERDARTFAGGMPVVAHPPCRAWGRLRHMAKPRPGERELAIWAVDQIRVNGGVLEHPAASRLWPEYGLPTPGRVDRFGGYTAPIRQWDFGHRAEKKTFLYICGVHVDDLPQFPVRAGEPTHVIAQDTRGRHGGPRAMRGDPKWKPSVTSAEREHTPPALAEWLVAVARLCQKEPA